MHLWRRIPPSPLASVTQMKCDFGKQANLYHINRKCDLGEPLKLPHIKILSNSVNTWSCDSVLSMEMIRHNCKGINFYRIKILK
jgi:hypothetical protein